MSALGGGMSFYGEMPDSYNIVINPNHPLITRINDELINTEGEKLLANDKERERLNQEIAFMEGEHKKKKEEEISQFEKDDLEKLRSELKEIEDNREKILESFGAGKKDVRQLIDLALLANNMLKGEALSDFVKRSVELL